MMKTLDNDSFLKEMINHKVEVFPEEFSEMCFFNRNFFKGDDEIDVINTSIYNIFHKASLSLKDGEEKIFLHETKLPHSDYSLFIVSKNYIVGVTDRFFTVMDTHSNFLFIIRPYNMSNNNFDFCFFKNPKRQPELTMTSNKFSLKIKKDNVFRIKSSLSLTGLSFNENSIEALFSSDFPCSKMKLDYQYNILEAELNKKLKKTLGINKKLQYENVKNYSDLINKINLSIEDSLDLYTLINDEKFKLKTSESKFHRDIEYIKSIVSIKEKILETKDYYEKPLSACYYFYNDLFKHFNIDFTNTDYISENKLQNTIFINYKESETSKRELKKYKFLSLLELKNSNIINEKLLDTVREITLKSKDVLSFNLKLCNLNQFKRK